MMRHLAELIAQRPTGIAGTPDIEEETVAIVVKSHSGKVRFRQSIGFQPGLFAHDVRPLRYTLRYT